MFKSEKIFLFLLVSVCLIISVVLLDSVIDPAILINTAFARITGSPVPEVDRVYQPDLEGFDQDELSEFADSLLQEGWNLFRSEGFAFEILFPQQLVQKSSLNQGALNVGIGLAPEAPVWQFRLNDPEYYQGTNLVDASLVIHVVDGVDQEAVCSSFLPGSLYQTPNQYRESMPQEEINGNLFWKDEVLEGVMGEFYQRISYRTFAKGACYQLTQLLHYRNIDSYFDDEVEEFDFEQVVAELDQVIATFSFLDIEPKFPDLSYSLPKTITDPVSKTTSGYVDGLDVSHWQNTIDWPKVVDAGYVFTFAKGTEGVGWTDRKFHQNMTNGVNAGEIMGVYHFARPDLGNDASEEANYFLDVVGDYLKSGYLRPVLDLEVGSSLGKTALTNWVMEWMETVENRTGISPLIYTNPSYIHYYLTDAVTEYDLWVAHWTCVPNVTYYYPNTGPWRDWAFWQYYGPGGCGMNYGYVPGITTAIDLNIFNGVEDGLQEYDAFSKLWVSLTSDAYFKPAPYSAVLTGNVNGDATGLMDFAFWWECTALEADLATVEGICGALPVPAEGECESNDVGMRCIGVENEKQLAEHTYQEIGNYTAKVIVTRGEEAPVEDRFKVAVYNPIRWFEYEPTPPHLAVIDETVQLRTDVVLHTSLEGVLQVTVTDKASGDILGTDCIPVIGNNQSVESFEFSLLETEPLEKIYQVSARYRRQGDCPVVDVIADDISADYQVFWMDDKAILSVLDENGLEIPAGGLDDLGLTELFETNQQAYLIKNPSALQGLQLSSASFDNQVNIANLQIDLVAPQDIGPEAEVPFIVSFEVPSSGRYAFDIVLGHDASNQKPFLFTVQGSGGLSDSPIKSITAQPLSPGSNWIGDVYDLHVDIDLDPPVGGALQVSVESLDGTTIIDSVCQSIPAASDLYGFDLSWIEGEIGMDTYQIWARYRDSGSCPISDSSDLDLSQGYQVDWQEDAPILELFTAGQSAILSGGVDGLGAVPLFEAIEVQYLVSNPSQTSDLELTGVDFGQSSNLAGLDVLSALPIQVGPGEEVPLLIGFEVVSPAAFSAQLNLEHTASNPSPFSFTIQGEGESISNPIQSITPQPGSPGQVLIGDQYQLEIAVGLDAPTEGALRLRLLDSAGNPVLDPVCQLISAPGADLVLYNLAWSESEVALRSYDIVVEFYSREGCPPVGQAFSELSAGYQVNWQEELPELELLNSGGSLVEAGSTVNIGQYEYYQTVDLAYLIKNNSSTSSLNITSLGIENLTNVQGVALQPDSSLILPKEGEKNLTLSFLVGYTGEFSFDLVIEHQGANSSPYRITFQGEGIMSDNPIQYVVPSPSSPASSLIGSPFELSVEIGLGVPDQGALQLSLVDKGSGAEVDRDCQSLVDGLDQPRTVNLAANRAVPGSREYELIAKYRVQGACPIQDVHQGDLVQSYWIDWEEEIPTLGLTRNGLPLLAGDTDIVGDQTFYQQVTLTYLVHNTSTTTDLMVQGLQASNLINVADIETNPAGAFVVPPGGEVPVSVSFLVAETDNFSFDLGFRHEGANSSPYTITVLGTGIMEQNPFKNLSITPLSPVELFISESMAVEVQVEIDPPAPGVVRVSLGREGYSELMGQTCFSILGEHSFLNVDLNWEETIPGLVDYVIDVDYQALGECPLAGYPDANISATYQVNWKTHQPELTVNRPEGVTIFDGAVDYIGNHDFFRFVEVTYVIDNGSNDGPLVIDSIVPENLVNLREVIIEPAGVIEIQPGESQAITISFQVLTLEPYSFDLVWTHNGSNPSPYITGIMGDSTLNLGDTPVDSWLYRFLESLIRSGFFLKLPILGLFLLKRKK